MRRRLVVVYLPYPRNSSRITTSEVTPGKDAEYHVIRRGVGRFGHGRQRV